MRVLAGDFPKKTTISITKVDVRLVPPQEIKTGTPPKTTIYTKDEIDEVVLANEENVKRIGGTIGWGIAGATLLGPVGLLAGLIGGGKGKDVVFIILFSDGKKIMIKSKNKDYLKVLALTMNSF